MDALPEPDMPRAAAGDVEVVRVGELALVAVGGTRDQHDPTAGGNALAVEDQLVGRRARSELQGCGESQCLLHSVPGEGGIVEEQTALVRVLGQQLEECPGQS